MEASMSTQGKSNWRTVVDARDWLVLRNSQNSEISLTHHPSLTRSEIQVNGTVIQALKVFSITRDRELKTDEDAGHWTRVHGTKAQEIIRRFFT
jgi:hypothetical protein